MATAELLKADGTVDSTMDIDAVEFNEGLVHQALVHELANRRDGSANTKTRSEVRGGGRKPWKQKGTGRARAGSIRSPLWVGGGVMFGPKPRDFANKFPKKMRKAALRCALFADPSKIKVVNDYSFVKESKTSEVAGFLKSAGLCKANVLLLVDTAKHPNIVFAARNLANVTLKHPEQLTVKALLHSDVILVDKASLEALQAKYAKETSAA